MATAFATNSIYTRPRNDRLAQGLRSSVGLLFGYHMPSFNYDGEPGSLFEKVVERALAAERAGFDLVTVMDHFYQIRGVGPETAPMMEAYTTLGAIAARTSRIRLGTLVTGVPYRNPALLAKMVTTLDVISNGRALLGIGAAWNESEHIGYGLQFRPIAERMERLDEALAIAKLMFTQVRPSFEGKHYRIDRALNYPRPIQPGGPKILVGGSGEKKTLRLLARHGDIGHWFGGDLADLKRKKQIFEQHCEVEGRDPAEVLLTVGVGLLLVEHERQAAAVLRSIPAERRAMVATATPQQAVEILGGYVDAGFGGFTLSNQTLPSLDAIGLAGELIRLMSRAVTGPG
jgi:F420-dependent oxidoreductase-like protein